MFLSNSHSSDIQDLTKLIIDFCDARNWKQFHSPKDLALSLTLEAAELLEHFQWKNEREVKEYVKNNKKEIGDELADLFYWVLLTSYYLKIDLGEALKQKMKENDAKYPVDKSKNRHTKYTELS